jgi:hypothetical protein
MDSISRQQQTRGNVKRGWRTDDSEVVLPLERVLQAIDNVIRQFEFWLELLAPPMPQDRQLGAWKKLPKIAQMTLADAAQSNHQSTHV